MKNWKKWSIIGGLILFLILIFVGIQVKKSSEKINKFQLIIDDYFKNEQFFVDESILKKRLEEAGMKEIQGKMVSEIDLIQLEKALEQIEYVAKAKAYFTMQKELVVEVSQRVPVLRVFNRLGQSYYVDQNGKLMATSPHFSAYTLVATGDIGTIYRKNGTDTSKVAKLAQIAYELGKQEQTSGLFTQISVEGDGVWLISRIEGFPCRIAINEPILPQVYKWLAFVAGADSTGGWRNRYEAVDLRFSNQVIGIQRGRVIQYGVVAPSPIDSSLKLAETIEAKEQKATTSSKEEGKKKESNPSSKKKEEKKKEKPKVEKKSSKKDEKGNKSSEKNKKKKVKQK